PASLARVVDGALLGNRRVGLAVDRAIGAVDQSLGRGEAQPDLREPPVGLDEAHVPEVDEIGAPDEILAKALELLRVVAGKPIGISLDDVALALGAAKDLAIGHRDAPRDLGLVETVATQQIKRQRPERVAADRKHLQEGRDRADTVALLECEGWRHARFAYLAGSLIDDEGGRCLDRTKTEGTLRIGLDRIVVQRLRCRAQSTDGKRRQDAQTRDGHSYGLSLERSPAMIPSIQVRAWLSRSNSANR